MLELKRRIIFIVKVLPTGLRRTAFFFILSLYNILSILLDICKECSRADAILSIRRFNNTRFLINRIIIIIITIFISIFIYIL